MHNATIVKSQPYKGLGLLGEHLKYLANNNRVELYTFIYNVELINYICYAYTINYHTIRPSLPISAR